MGAVQPAILTPPKAAGRFLTLGLVPDAPARDALERVARLPLGEGMDSTIVGLGDPLLRAAGMHMDELRPFPALSGPGGAFPSTQGALWLSLDGTDPGELLHRSRKILADLGGLGEL